MFSDPPLTRVVLFSEGSVIPQEDLIEAVRKLNFSRVNKIILSIQTNVTMVMKLVDILAMIKG